MGSGSTFKCNGNGFESLQEGYLDRGRVHWGVGGRVCECKGECTLKILVHLCKIFVFNSSQKLANQKQPKVTFLYVFKIDQS